MTIFDIPPPQVISFDCAGTLIDVRWDPAKLACDCLIELGVDFSYEYVESQYRSILQRRWPEFQKLNLTRSLELCDKFWEDVAREWLRSIQQPEELQPELSRRAWNEIYGSRSPLFRLYDDVTPCFQALKNHGYRLIVLSNWDVSLHRFVQIFGMTPYLELVIASLEEGVEKPDSKLFKIAESRLGIDCGQILHIGDDPLDDLKGARNAGWGALLLDRSVSEPSTGILSSLHQLVEALC
ncbi:MAG: HAD-IA family hydrolase [Armatimonadetes bacterium]|nr:HAD-IA family hydrolase [Armatimonadota bacterium]